MPSGKNYHGSQPEGYQKYMPPENTKQQKTASKGSPGSKPSAGAPNQGGAS
jgi:hypothetical protein